MATKAQVKKYNKVLQEENEYAKSLCGLLWDMRDAHSLVRYAKTFVKWDREWIFTFEDATYNYEASAPIIYDFDGLQRHCFRIERCRMDGKGRSLTRYVHPLSRKLYTEQELRNNYKDFPIWEERKGKI